MSENILLGFVTLLLGWLLGRLGASVEKYYERRGERNRLIFTLIQLYEDIAKRHILDDMVLSYAGSSADLAAIRKDARKAVPDEATQSLDHLHEMIRATSDYDPFFAQEINATLLPARMLDERLLTVSVDKEEFEVLLRLLSPMDRAMMKRLEQLSVELASRNGYFNKRKIRSFFIHRQATLKESIESQQRLRAEIKSKR